jgi:hypothetical protein
MEMVGIGVGVEVGVGVGDAVGVRVGVRVGVSVDVGVRVAVLGGGASTTNAETQPETRERASSRLTMLTTGWIRVWPLVSVDVIGPSLLDLPSGSTGLAFGYGVLFSGNARGWQGAMHSRTHPSMIRNVEERKSLQSPARFKCVAPGSKNKLPIIVKTIIR